MTDADSELLARYVGQQAEDAFAEIIRRHLGLVYSAGCARSARRNLLKKIVCQGGDEDAFRIKCLFGFSPARTLSGEFNGIRCRIAPPVCAES